MSIILITCHNNWKAFTRINKSIASIKIWKIKAKGLWIWHVLDNNTNKCCLLDFKLQDHHVLTSCKKKENRHENQLKKQASAPPIDRCDKLNRFKVEHWYEVAKSNLYKIKYARKAFLN